MHVGTHNPGYKYKMEGTELQEVTEEKDIGILSYTSEFKAHKTLQEGSRYGRCSSKADNKKLSLQGQKHF